MLNQNEGLTKQERYGRCTLNLDIYFSFQQTDQYEFQYFIIAFISRNSMKTSKNRQTGFIKNYTSFSNIESHYQSPRVSQGNKFFLKNQDDFSSFDSKEPTESQNSFSLFVFKAGKSPRKTGAGEAHLISRRTIDQRGKRKSRKELAFNDHLDKHVKEKKSEKRQTPQSKQTFRKRPFQEIKSIFSKRFQSNQKQDDQKNQFYFSFKNKNQKHLRKNKSQENFYYQSLTSPMHIKQNQTDEQPQKKRKKFEQFKLLQQYGEKPIGSIRKASSSYQYCQQNCPEVQESSVMQSQPSFLQQRIDEANKIQLQLLEEKRRLALLRKKKFEKTNRKINLFTSQSNQSNHAEILSHPVEYFERPNSNISSDSNPSDSNPSNSNQLDSHISNQKQSDSSGDLAEEQIDKNTKIMKLLNTNSTNNFYNAQMQTYNINPFNYPQVIQMSFKEPALRAIEQNESSEALQSQKAQEYKLEGIVVAKGGITFHIDTKEFVYDKNQLQSKSNHQNQHKQLNKANTQSRQTHKYFETNQKKNIKKVNSLDQIKRRRLRAKNYDQSTRMKLFAKIES